MKTVAGEEKKARNFLPPTVRGPTLRAPPFGAPKGGAPKGGGPKFRAFSSLSRHRFTLSVSLWVSSRGILVVFEAQGP